MKTELLVVDDDTYTVRFFKNLFAESDFEIDASATGEAALTLLREKDYDLVLLDLRLPDISGLEVLKEIHAMANAPEVVMITGFSTVESAVEAMKLGAFDYVKKPFDNLEEIKLLVDRALEKKQICAENEFLKRRIRDLALSDRFVAEDPKMKNVLDMVRKVAPLDNTVLLTGESGTGKEMIASIIHENSPRAGKRFLTVNCGALTENLLESTLFGHEKGAFTGAIRQHKGYFEAAHDGTLFLDEIGEMNVTSQVKLLRVLEEKTFQRVGGTEDIQTNARIVAATNRDLQKEIETGNFREDLFYRINVVAVHLPPLREREVDIPLLIQFYFLKFKEKLKKDIRGISAEAMDLLLRYPWPGNVRELRNVIERAVILEEGSEIAGESLPEKISQRSKNRHPTYFDLPFSKSKEAFERDYITHALKSHQGNVVKASRHTKIPRQNFYLKLKKYGVDPDQFRP